MARVLIFSYLPPASLAGGPIRSIQSLVELVGGHHLFFVISPSRELDGSSINYNFLEMAAQEGLVFNVKDNITPLFLYSFIWKNKIDTIYLNSFFNYKLIILSVLIKFFLKVRIILAPRGELEPGALQKNYFFKQIYIKAFKHTLLGYIDIFHATSHFETFNFKKTLNLNGRRIIEIPNLTNHIIRHRLFKSSNKSVNELKLVFFSRIVPKKNLSRLLYLIGTLGDVRVSLDIYGHIEDLEYWNECQQIIGKFPSDLGLRVCYKGIIDIDRDLFINKISVYDFFVFPTLSENFGHVIMEAFASGIPVVINDTTPFSSVVRSYNLGHVIDFNDHLGFNETIVKCISLDLNSHMRLKKNIKRFLSENRNVVLENVSLYDDLFSCSENVRMI